MNELQAAPEPFDPQEVAKKIQVLTKQLDELQTNVESRPLHDFLQDSLMPMLGVIQEEITTLTFYLSAHEDRILEIENEQESQLLPEDAGPLLKYLQKTVEVFTQMKAQKTFPGLEKLIESGESMIEFVQEITLDGDDDADEDADA